MPIEKKKILPHRLLLCERRERELSQRPVDGKSEATRVYLPSVWLSLDVSFAEIESRLVRPPH